MKKGLLLLILATFLWGGNYIAGAFLGPSLPASLLNTIRWFISTILLIGIMVINNKPLYLFKKWKEFSILGFLGVFSFSTLNYIGLKHISSSQAGMISAGIPVAILLLTPIFLKEKVHPKSWIGAIISIIGVFILIIGKQTDSTENSIFGVAIIILSCFAWALYTILGKRFGKEMDSLTMTTGAAFYGTLFSALSCIGSVDGGSIHMNTTAWLCVIYVSTFASVGAYLAWNAGVKIIGVGRSGPYINLLPVWTVVLGLILLHEQVSGITSLGGVIIFIGAILASL